MKKRIGQPPNKIMGNSCLESKLERIRQQTGSSSDIVIRELCVGKNDSMNMGIIYTDGLINQMYLAEFVIQPISQEWQTVDLRKTPKEHTLASLKQSIIKVGDLREIMKFEEIFPDLLSGRAILLMDGFEQGISIGIGEWKDRPVSETMSETVVRGPKAAFTETLKTNITQIRRIIKDPNLWVKNRTIGRISQTNLSIMYVNGVVNESVITELHARLDKIDTDAILESGYIEEYIQDTTFTPFPTVYSTERPDVVAASILEGRVAILVDGTPFVLIVPCLFLEFYQAASDYYQRADISTLIRFLRLLAFFIALLGTALFLSITTFHQETIPPILLVVLVSQREGVPFPAIIEALLLEMSFEILREAGLRMPRAIGNAVSVVGTLVIGTAAVEAGFVSAAMVIVVALSSISSFVIPSDSMSIAVRMLRFGFMILAASFGIFGMVTGVIALLLHLCHLKSFGVPYFTPFGPFVLEDQKDSLFRFPHWGLLTRPRYLSKNHHRGTPIRGGK